MTRLRFWLLMLVTVILSSSPSAYAETSKQGPAPVVLTGCHIWDGTAEKATGPQEILVKDGKIAAMGKSVPRPVDARVVDLSGHTVTPGFIDAHVHVAINPEDIMGSGLRFSSARQALNAVSHLRDLLMNGFTTVRDVAGFDQQYVVVDIKHAVEAGEIIGPRMFVAPHFLTATGAHGDVMGLLASDISSGLKAKALVDSPDEARRVVREEIRSGADWIKFGATGGFVSPSDEPSQATFSQEEMNAIVQTAHDLGIPVSAHAYGGEGLKRSILAGIDSAEHASLATPEILSLIKKKGIYLVPTQYTSEDSLNNIDNPAYWKGHTRAEYLKTLKYADAIRSAQRNLANSDVKVVFGTDTGLFPFKDNWKEFPTMVKNGINPLRALKSATSTAAEMLRCPNTGVLAVGKMADIIAMPGNPLLDISLTGKVDFVMKEGFIYKQ